MVGPMTFKKITKEDLKKRYLNEKLTKKELNDLAEEFFVSMKDKSFEETGFVNSMYGMSKLHIIVFTRIFA